MSKGIELTKEIEATFTITVAKVTDNCNNEYDFALSYDEDGDIWVELGTCGPTTEGVLNWLQDVPGAINELVADSCDEDIVDILLAIIKREDGRSLINEALKIAEVDND